MSTTPLMRAPISTADAVRMTTTIAKPKVTVAALTGNVPARPAAQPAATLLGGVNWTLGTGANTGLLNTAYTTGTSSADKYQLIYNPIKKTFALSNPFEGNYGGMADSESSAIAQYNSKFGADRAALVNVATPVGPTIAAAPARAIGGAVAKSTPVTMAQLPTKLPAAIGTIATGVAKPIAAAVAKATSTAAAAAPIASVAASSSTASAGSGATTLSSDPAISSAIAALLGGGQGAGTLSGTSAEDANPTAGDINAITPQAAPSVTGGGSTVAAEAAALTGVVAIGAVIFYFVKHRKGPTTA